MPHRNADDPAALPLGATDARHAAAATGLAIPDACLEGVLASLALLARHAAVLRGEDRSC